MSSTFLLYGANGYTGSLIARMAVQRGLRPILAGRNQPAITQLAGELGLEYRIFELENKAALRAALSLAPVVLHCAGPFAHTAHLMADGCLYSGTHYLDITGEIAVFETLAALDVEARKAGVMVLPGAGFDVVPSDCLAAHLKRRVPTANRLTLAFTGGAGAPRGTLLTAIEGMRQGGAGMIRRNGRLTPVPFAWKQREVDFGRGPQTCLAIPWGDVASAWYSTEIPNIEVYMAISGVVKFFLSEPEWVAWLLRQTWVHNFLQKRVTNGAPGPSEAERRKGRSILWGMAESSGGVYASARLQTPEAYTLTALSALAIVQKVLAGHYKMGYQTPSTAYGADFILEIEGVVRVDL